jgi:hypothetical protein
LAPDLVQIRSEFDEADIQFVGLTSAQADREVDGFLETYGQTWPNAIVAQQSIDELKRAMSSPTSPDIRVTMLIVVDQLGRIVWTDDARRWRHQHQNLGQELREVLQRSLLALQS